MTDHDTTDAEIRQAIRDRIEPQEYRDDEQAWCAVDAAVKVFTEREARKDAEIAEAQKRHKLALLEALGMDPLRDWDDIVNAARGLRGARDQADAEIARLREYAETTRYHQQKHREAVRELEEVRAALARYERAEIDKLSALRDELEANPGHGAASEGTESEFAHPESSDEQREYPWGQQ